MEAPAAQQMRRDDGITIAASTERYCCGLFGKQTTPPVFKNMRKEHVFYDSAKASRTCIGGWHYCIACPGWSKITDRRVVYSRWDMVPPSKMPAKCIESCCDFGGGKGDWMGPPDPTEIKSKTSTEEAAEQECCGMMCPCGRTLDTFDADIVVDASAHQTCCQICRDEGDVVLYRKAGADLSDSSEVFVMADVVKPFDVFNEVTFELSKINLQVCHSKYATRSMPLEVCHTRVGR